MTIAIVPPAEGEGLAELVEQAHGQSWKRKEILVASRRELSREGGEARADFRRVPLSEAASPHEVLARSARGEWIQWLGPGERLLPTKVEGQLREAGELRQWDLLASPYRLRQRDGAQAFHPCSEPLAYAARLGASFPFAAPLLWSTKALRSVLLRRPLAGSSEEMGRGILRWVSPKPRIGLGAEAGSDCSGRAEEPTRGEWTAALSWALLLASAAERGAPAAFPERKRIFLLLREMDPSLAYRMAERLGDRDLLAEAAPRRGWAGAVGRVAGPGTALRMEEVGRRLREAESGFRRWRRGLRRPIASGRGSVSARPARAEGEAYASWIEAYERLDRADREAIRREIGGWAKRPLLSVVMPVFNTPEEWLQRAIDSVREQLYPDWELCLADDGSTAPHVRPLLEANRERDPRIRAVFRERSGGIAAASNSALALAGGEWVVLLDHDDELPEEAFSVVVREILRDPELRLLYSDEDKIDESGRRFDPYFKPDFSYDLLLSQNCISHLGVYHAGLLRSLGGFRSGYDGSQDYDLALRFVERLEPGQIRHIPRVLYHWRAIASSAAARVEAKPYAYEAARRAIGDHLGRIGDSAEVLRTRIAWGYRVRRRAPADLRASFLLGAGGDEERLRRSVESIRGRTEGQGYELLLVGGKGWERAESVRTLAPPAELSGPRIWNWAARQARGEVLVFLEAPVEAREGGWLAELVGQAMRPQVGAVGARILAADGTVAEAGVVLGLEGSVGAAFRGWSGESIGYFGQAILVRNPSAASAACLATRKALFEEYGGFDEGYRERFWDLDYCLRLREAGCRIVFTPYAELVRGEASGEAPVEDRERFRKRWAQAIERDPGYNPNLGLECGGYGLAWPPRMRRPWRE